MTFWGKVIAVLAVTMTLASVDIAAQLQRPPDEEANQRTVEYAVVAPKSARVGYEYTVSVTIMRSTDANVTARLQGVQTRQVIAENSVVVAAGTTMDLTLQVPMAIRDLSFNLHIFIPSLEVREVTEITVAKKTMSILVQTDKAIYKPGQNVQFRVITLKPDLKPYVGSFDVFMEDPQNNRVAQWLDMDTSLGVANASLQLSREPPLGEWKIVVEHEDQTIEKVIEVKEYVLPKFSVDIDTPSFFVVPSRGNIAAASLKQPLIIRVTAKYTYGKCVSGKANIRLQVEPYGFEEPGHYRSLSHEQKVICPGDGVVQWVVPYDKVVEISPPPGVMDASSYYPGMSLVNRNLLIEASVTEEVSGKVISSTTSPSIYIDKYQLEFLDITQDSGKPGLNFTAYIKLSKMDGSPPDAGDIDGQVCEIVAERRTTSIAITNSGVMVVSFPVHRYSLSLTAYCFEGRRITANKLISEYQTLSKESIQLSVMNTDGVARPGDTIQFMIMSVMPVATVYYQILGKGNIVDSRWLESTTATNEHTFDVILTSELALQLAPTARILVWIVSSIGEILPDTMDIRVDNVLNNDVTFSFSKSTATPGELNTLSIRADPNSLVGLLGVDKSVLLLKTGNDITEETVDEDLQGYDAPGQQDDVVLPFWRCFCAFSRGGLAPYAVLENAGVKVLTNGIVYRAASHRFDDMIQAAVGGGVEFEEDAMVEKDSPSNSLPPKKKTSNTRIRQNFPETWIWSDVVTGDDGMYNSNVTMPDTITNWVVSAFALNSETGIGFANPVEVTSFLPFFVRLDLPYFVVRNEVLLLKAVVFNYLSTTQTVDLTLEKSADFGIVKSHNDTIAVQKAVTLSFTVNPNDETAASWWIKPSQLGYIPITVMASSIERSDAVRRVLLVKPEGVPKYYSNPMYVDLRDTNRFEKTVSIPLPDNVVSGSLRITATATGDIMASSIDGLDHLVRMPYGCGEQNMINFAPNIFVLDYLAATSQNSPDIKNKAIGFMEIGYQREITFKHSDGSFSAFGDSDPSGSTWLTAFVVRCFHQAAAHMFVDMSINAHAVHWLLSQQAKDGTFIEPGRVIHTEMQGGSGNGLGMTAYTLIALLENNDQYIKEALQEMRPRYNIDRMIAKTRERLERLLPSYSGNRTIIYELAIMSYALALSGSDMVDDALEMLGNLVTEEDGMKHWEVPDERSQSSTRVNYRNFPKSRDVEATAYVLLALVNTGRALTHGKPIASWLTSQQSSTGGFSSTQDTVIALQALAEYGSSLMDPKLNMRVSVDTGSSLYNFETITRTNALLLQSVEVDSSSRNITVMAEGNGTTFVQVNAAYNIEDDGAQKAMSVRVTGVQVNDNNEVSVSACLRWDGDDSSGMSLLQANAFSGYSWIAESVDELKAGSSSVSRVDIDNENLNIYFNEIGKREECLTMKMEKIFVVADIQPAHMRASSYYQPEKNAGTFFAINTNTDMCSVCQDCGCPGNAPRLVTSLTTLIILTGVLIVFL